MFASRHFANFDKKNVLKDYPAETLFKFASPDSVLPIQQYRPIAMEILFDRKDEKSQILQNQLLIIYLEKIYNEPAAESHATNAMLKALQSHITRRKATFSQKLIYVLMQAKINNITAILDEVSKINGKLIDIKKLTHLEDPFYQEMLTVFVNTFSNETKKTYMSRIEEGLGADKTKDEKICALLALSFLGKANKPAYITPAWVDAVAHDMDKQPFHLFLATLESMYQARPDLVASERVDEAAQKLNHEDLVWNSFYVREKALKILEIMFKARPDFIESKVDAIFEKLKDNGSDVRVAALQTIKTICQSRPDLITRQRVDAVVKLTRGTTWPEEDKALKALEVMIRMRPEFITNTLLNTVITTRSFPSSFWISSPIKVFRTMLQARPDLSAAITRGDPGKLNEVDSEVRADVLEVIRGVYRARPDFVTETSVAKIYQIFEQFSGDKNMIYLAIRTLKSMFQVRPDLVTVERLHGITCYLDDEYFLRRAALKAIKSIVETRQDLIAHIHTDSIVRAIEGGHACLTLGRASEALQTVIHALPELAKNNVMNSIISKELGAYVHEWRYGAFHVCASMFEENPDFCPQHRPDNLEGQVLEFYMQAMKLLPHPVVLAQSQNTSGRTVMRGI